MSETLLHYIGDAGLVVALLAILVFVVRYAQTKWTTFSEGIHMMVFSLVVAIALGWGTYTVFFVESETAALVVRIFIWWSIAAVLIWRDRILFKAQKRKKKRRDDYYAAFAENEDRNRISAVDSVD